MWPSDNMKCCCMQQGAEALVETTDADTPGKPFDVLDISLINLEDLNASTSPMSTARRAEESNGLAAEHIDNSQENLDDYQLPKCSGSSESKEPSAEVCGDPDVEANGADSGTFLIEGKKPTQHPLVVAWYRGRIVEARRELARMEAAKYDLSCFDPKLLEQIRRIGGKYDESLAMLNTEVSSLPVHETNSKLKLAWGLSLANGTLRATFSVERDLELVKSVVAFQEKDLDVGLKESVVRVDSLGDPSANDSLWRVISFAKSLGTKGDDIIVESSADALDEPLGSIWMSGYSPPVNQPARPPSGEFPDASAGAADGRVSNSSGGSGGAAKPKGFFKRQGSNISAAPSMVASKSRKLIQSASGLMGLRRQKTNIEVFNGVFLPRPEAGHNRSTSLFFATKITPLHASGSERLRGFKQTSVVEAKLNPVVYAIVSVLPGFIMRRMARGQLEKNIGDFETKVKTVKALDERIGEAPRSRFYENLRKHLSGERPDPVNFDDVSKMLIIPKKRTFESNSTGSGTEVVVVAAGNIEETPKSSKGGKVAFGEGEVVATKSQ